MILSVICAVIGILLSILAGTPVGSTIVAADMAAFFISCVAGRMMGEDDMRRKNGLFLAFVCSLHDKYSWMCKKKKARRLLQALPWIKS